VGSTPQNLAFVAAQDGDGEWQALQGNDGVYAFDSQGRFGWAYQCDDPTWGPYIEIIHATTIDFVEVSRRCSPNLPSTTRVHFNVIGLDATHVVDVSISNYGASGFGASFEVDIPSGTWTVVAARRTSSYPGTSDRVIVRPDVAVQGAETTITLDFTSEGENTVERQVTITNASADEIVYLYNVPQIAGTSALPLSHDEAETVPTVPAALLAGDGRNVVELLALGQNTPSIRQVTVSATTPDDQEHSFLGLFPITATVVSQTPVQVSFGFDAQPNAKRYGFSVVQQSGDAYVSWGASISAGWLAGAPQADYTMPDLSDVPGWDPAWGVTSGIDLGWRGAVIEGTDAISFDDPPAPASDGAVESLSEWSGGFVP
jgi:hypothetical protein